jgi:hypothetical protein
MKNTEEVTALLSIAKLEKKVKEPLMLSVNVDNQT